MKTRLGFSRSKKTRGIFIARGTWPVRHESTGLSCFKASSSNTEKKIRRSLMIRPRITLKKKKKNG